MKTFTDFKTFNTYFGTEPPLDNHIDVNSYGKKFLKKSEAVSIDFYRISLKQKICLPKNHPLYDSVKQPFSAFFFSSPKDVNSWCIEKRFKRYYVQFSHKIINENKHIFKKLMDFGQHEPLFLTSQDEQEIEQNYKYMLRHHQENPQGYDIILSYALVIFNFIEKLYLSALNKSSSKFNSIVIEFQESLNNYYTSQLSTQKYTKIPTVNHFASQMGVSANYLGDILKNYTGQSAIDHIHQHIVKQAKVKLLKTNTPVKEIAWELGFEYPNYFARFFKNKTGLTGWGGQSEPPSAGQTEHSKLSAQNRFICV
ncbi:helix-turn-helix domain-containing protein [Formosa sp. A9]|uniref:AraC family transcriptional regulator n=1 Tax=Formosa sp. A9 TaxID=3442641 RepID=UPI003EBD445A